MTSFKSIKFRTVEFYGLVLPGTGKFLSASSKTRTQSFPSCLRPGGLKCCTPNLSEVIRRLRLARVRVASIGDERLTALLDQALDQIEGPLPRINEVIWHLEEGLANLELA